MFFVYSLEKTTEIYWCVRKQSAEWRVLEGAIYAKAGWESVSWYKHGVSLEGYVRN